MLGDAPSTVVIVISQEEEEAEEDEGTVHLDPSSVGVSLGAAQELSVSEKVLIESAAERDRVSELQPKDSSVTRGVRGNDRLTDESGGRDHSGTGLGVFDGYQFQLVVTGYNRWLLVSIGGYQFQSVVTGYNRWLPISTGGYWL